MIEAYHARTLIDRTCADDLLPYVPFTVYTATGDVVKVVYCMYNPAINVFSWLKPLGPSLYMHHVHVHVAKNFILQLKVSCCKH